MAQLKVTGVFSLIFLIKSFLNKQHSGSFVMQQNDNKMTWKVGTERELTVMLLAEPHIMQGWSSTYTAINKLSIDDVNIHNTWCTDNEYNKNALRQLMSPQR